MEDIKVDVSQKVKLNFRQKFSDQRQWIEERKYMYENI